MESEYNTLLMYKLRWLSKSKVLSRVFELSDHLRRFFLNQHVNIYFVTYSNVSDLVQSTCLLR